MNGWYSRLRERARHGLLLQEGLDRLSHLGLTIYPYLVMEESTVTAGTGHQSSADIAIDEIKASESRLLASAAAQRLSADKAALRFSRGHRCFGIRHDGRLAGYAWCRFDHCISIVHNAPLFALAAGEAHVYDTWIASPFRGRGLAVALRRQVCNVLQREGFHAVFSLCLLCDRSARRVFEKLGAMKRETRVLLGLRRRWYRDFHLKSFGKPLPIARIHRPVRLP